VIEIRLFGDLRRYARQPGPSLETVLHRPGEAHKTVQEVLAGLDIDPEEVSHIFLNGRLLPRSVYPITLGYPLGASQVLSLDRFLQTPVRDGDRLGIFPRNMGVVVV
jgi:hypothetical protein